MRFSGTDRQHSIYHLGTYFFTSEKLVPGAGYEVSLTPGNKFGKRTRRCYGH